MSRSAPPQQSSWPEPPRQFRVQPGGDDDPTAVDWQMSPLPPEEPVKQQRRLWIWVLALALLGCLSLCVISFTWLEHTDSGRNFQTRVSVEQTKQAGK